MSCCIVPLPTGIGLRILLPGLAEMHRGCFPDDPWDADVLSRIIGLAGIFGRLAWADDTPSGFVLARDLGGEVEVLSLGVIPEARRLGVGHALLQAVLAEADQCGAASVVLEVAEDNAAARRLYRVCGFIEAGRRPRYYRRAKTVVDGLLLRRSAAAQKD
jgi:[ribosomal protein S18]-alanine N-acetyltransferase